MDSDFFCDLCEDMCADFHDSSSYLFFGFCCTLFLFDDSSGSFIGKHIVVIIIRRGRFGGLAALGLIAEVIISILEIIIIFNFFNESATNERVNLGLVFCPSPTMILNFLLFWFFIAKGCKSFLGNVGLRLDIFFVMLMFFGFRDLLMAIVIL